MKPINIFIFRRDLRCRDNKALYKLSKSNGFPIMPIFIFNKQQTDPQRNPYYSEACFGFMLESLGDLKADVPCLNVFEGNDVAILSKILSRFSINTVAFNVDHTPFAKQRDSLITTWCANNGVHVLTDYDYVLFPYEHSRLREKGCYEVFTPFYRKCLKIMDDVERPYATIPHRRWLQIKMNGTINIPQHKVSPALRNLRGGRTNALQILENVYKGSFSKYESTRDIPILDKTTKLSAYLKFGCVSVREAFWACVDTYGKGHGLVREVLWREFYAHIMWHLPRLLNGEPMKLKYKNVILWKPDNAHTRDSFKKWCDGKTGFPFVDAGMRCLLNTGFLHNRLRMVVAMFLVKDMHIDWRWGERFFAQHLVDYDPASNSGGWQWAASVGADAQPYYRIFNPWIQSSKFDRTAEFIKKWVPELKDVPAKDIHEWHATHSKHVDVDYPPPILDHKERAQEALRMFTSLSKPKKKSINRYHEGA